MIPAADGAMRQKYFLRLHYRAEVRALPPSDRRRAADALARRVAVLPEFRRARVVGAFLSASWEISTKPLISIALKDGKTVAVPVVTSKGGIAFAEWWPGVPCAKNKYGILEPVHPRWADDLDVVLVPGAAFTPEGARLGGGAGCYDRFLSRHPRLASVGLCHDEQMAVRLPMEPHDRPVSAVATPSGVRRARYPR